jgi:hypothetical protein
LSKQVTGNVNVEELDFREPQRIEQKFTHAMKNYFKGKIDAVILCHGVIVEAGVQNCVIKDFD